LTYNSLEMGNQKKIILVTGASAGLGKEFAKELLKDGHVVYGAARRIGQMDDIKRLGINVLEMDVTDEASMVKGIEAIIKNEKRIDVLVNNAGFGSYGALEDVSMADARYQLEVNVIGATRLIQLVLPYMREQHDGLIINISSIGGKVAFPFGGWYHASKFALEALSDVLRNEVKPFGIDVVLIEPGGVKTEYSHIATDKLMKTSGNSVYGQLVKELSGRRTEIESKVPGPIVIAKLVKQAIDAKKPKTRYSGGYRAGLTLFLRRLLSDRMLDWVITKR